MEGLRARQKQQEQQQGFGRPIISLLFQGVRYVAVGNRLYHSSKWKTFHDFLLSYIRDVIGGSWGDAELKKPRDTRHPLLNWYEDTTRQLNSFIKERGVVHTAPATGTTSAYLELAYNLYLISHNVALQEALICRIKNAEHFLPAVYETRVAAALIQAGFDVRFEDETDPSVQHCEFIATFRATGKKFSVEAKMRRPDKHTADVGNQLYAALRKPSEHPRVVFIELNLPSEIDDQNRPSQLKAILDSLRTRETKLTIDGEPAPPAYVVITNNPHHYSPDSPATTWVLVEGFKIPDFKFEAQYATLREAREARDRHIEVTMLTKSFKQHTWVPSTFDAEIPELEFGKTHERLEIGKYYRIPKHDGTEVVAQLLFAHVLEKEKEAVGIYRTNDGKSVFAKCPLTDDEIAGYKSHPETFFGVVQSTTDSIRDPLEIYDWLYESYSKLPKEKLLELMKEASDFDRLKGLSQQALAETFCERVVYDIMR